MPYMTQADRHREEGEARLQDGDVCPHGRPAGFSNYDVRWCGACEMEEYQDYLDEMAERGLEDTVMGARRCPSCDEMTVYPGNVSGVCARCDRYTGPGLGDIDDELNEAIRQEYLDRRAEREMEEDAIRSAEEREH